MKSEQNNKLKKEIEFGYNTGKVERRFTEDWANSGVIRLEVLPAVLESILIQRKEMVDYIEALHDKLDYIMERNAICIYRNCHTAGCDSDHK